MTTMDELRLALDSLGVDLNAFQEEAAQWAKEAKQCKSCEAWAKLNESDICLVCTESE